MTTQLSNEDAEISSSLSEHVPKIQTLVKEHILSSPRTRKELGLFIRELANKGLGDSWKLGVYFAMIVELVQAGVDSTTLSKDEEIVSKYQKFLDAIRDLELDNAHTLRPLIDVRFFFFVD